MSIQNILVPNDLTLYCGAINVDGVQAPAIETLSQSFTPYYNSIGTPAQTLVFTKISIPGGRGMVFVSIPAFSVDTSAASSTLYFDLAGVPKYSIFGNNALQQVVEIVNNSVSAYGRAYVDSVSQRIYISAAHGANFTMGGVGGLEGSILLSYLHSDV